MKHLLSIMVMIALMTQAAAQLSLPSQGEPRLSPPSQGGPHLPPPSQGGASGGIEGHATSQPTETRPAVRFEAIDVYIDSAAQPLAAYQFELLADAASVKIVGVEGGEHAAFREPPYYDPAALSHNRIIIAAFNTGRDLPKGKTRIARLHVQVTGPEQQYKTKLDVAATVEGKEIPATASVGAGVRP